MNKHVIIKISFYIIVLSYLTISCKSQSNQIDFQLELIYPDSIISFFPIKNEKYQDGSLISYAGNVKKN